MKEGVSLPTCQRLRGLAIRATYMHLLASRCRCPGVSYLNFVATDDTVHRCDEMKGERSQTWLKAMSLQVEPFMRTMWCEELHESLHFTFHLLRATMSARSTRRTEREPSIA